MKRILIARGKISAQQTCEHERPGEEGHGRKLRSEAASIFPAVRPALPADGGALPPCPPGAHSVIIIRDTHVNHEGAVMCTEAVNIYVQCK